MDQDGHILDSGKIAKTFSTETLGEKSSKRPRCQETKRVSGASARQMAPTKRSNDSSGVVNTPKGNEDRYSYDELMEMCGKIRLDMDKQAKEIKRQEKQMGYQEKRIAYLEKQIAYQDKQIAYQEKQIAYQEKQIAYQQKQIDKLMQTVTRMEQRRIRHRLAQRRIRHRLAQRRTRQRFVLKRRTMACHDASKKGESHDTSKPMEDDFEGLNTGMDTKFEGESGAKSERVIEKDEQVLESSAPEVKKKYPLASKTSSKAAETALSQKEREAVEAILHFRRI